MGHPHLQAAVVAQEETEAATDAAGAAVGQQLAAEVVATEAAERLVL